MKTITCGAAQAQHTSPAPHCRVLLPGEFNNIIQNTIADLRCDLWFKESWGPPKLSKFLLMGNACKYIYIYIYTKWQSYHMACPISTKDSKRVILSKDVPFGGANNVPLNFEKNWTKLKFWPPCTALSSVNVLLCAVYSPGVTLQNASGYSA